MLFSCCEMFLHGKVCLILKSSSTSLLNCQCANGVVILGGGSEVNLGLILGIPHKILLFLLDLSWFFNSKVFASFILSYRNSGHKIGLISSFLSNRQLLVVLDGQPSQEHPVNAGAPQGSSLGPGLSLPYINDLPDKS